MRFVFCHIRSTVRGSQDRRSGEPNGDAVWTSATSIRRATWSPDRQVSRYGQASEWGAVLGCIRPSRSPCTSMRFAQLNWGVWLRL